MSLMCNVFTSLEPDYSVINSSKLFWILITWLLSYGFKPCGTTVLIYSSLNKEQQKQSQKHFILLVYLPKDLKMRLLISSAYHEGINGVYLLTKYGPKK